MPLKSTPAIFETTSPLMEKLKAEKKTAREFQARRHDDWNENYELYRNKVKTNRLTQRQTVNIPLMKETVKTLISKIDDPPVVDWKELGGDITKELIFQEVWNSDFDRLNFEGLDIQDKKSVLLYGRAFKKLNWKNGELEVRALDIYDVVVDPLTDPLDLETARYVIHQNIFRSLKEVIADERYSAKGREKLKIFLSSEEGMLLSSQNKEAYEKRSERLEAMGMRKDKIPELAAGDFLVNLSEHYTQEWNEKTKEFERRVIVYADDTIELMDDKLEELIGVEFYPLLTWAEDIETQDFWSDGPADLVRVPNKIINVWFSQLVENRTLKNFQMHWYDATVQGYSPQTYEPGPGRMLPAPGDPNKTIMPVNISGLDDTLTAIDFIIKLVERGTSATAIEKGVSERKQITLGEVQMLVGKAMERTLSMAKFYRRSWQEFAQKYYAIINENAKEKKTLYKTDRNGKLWPKIVYASDWKSKQGFKAQVRSSSEQEEEKTKGIQRMMFVLQQNPDNLILRRVLLKRQLDLLDLSVEEIREIEEAEKKKAEEIPLTPEAIQGAAPVQTPSPEEGALMGDLEKKLAALEA